MQLAQKPARLHFCPTNFTKNEVRLLPEQERCKTLLKREHAIPQCFGKFRSIWFYKNMSVMHASNYFGENNKLFRGRGPFESIERLRHGIMPEEKMKRKVHMRPGKRIDRKNA